MLCSARGAPGVTTTSLLLAARFEDAALVEGDLAGGVLAVRYGLGREPGLVTLAASNPTQPGGWLDHAQDAGGVAVLVGPDSGEAAESLWRSAGERIVSVLARSEGLAVVDAGRLRPQGALVESADLFIVMLRPVAEQVVTSAHAIASLRRSARGPVSAILVGDGPYGARDIEEALGCPVLAHLPHDPDTADHLRDGGTSSRAVARSRLARSIAGVGDVIEVHLDSSAPGSPEEVLVR